VDNTKPNPHNNCMDLTNNLPVQLEESEVLEIIDRNRALDATNKLIQLVLDTTEFSDLTQRIVDLIPAAMGYQLGLILTSEPENQRLVKASVSKYAEDVNLSKVLAPLYNAINIPYGYEDNLAVKAFKEAKQFVSPYLWEVFKPVITKEQAGTIQDTVSATAIIVTPIFARGDVIGILIVGLPKTMDQVTNFERSLLKKFSKNVGIAIENARQFSKLKTEKEELHKAFANLQVLNTLKDEFLSVASHELRTPMTIVKSYLWMLDQQEAGKMNTKQLEYLHKASDGTQRMINLINDMLNISRFEQKKVTYNIVQLEIVSIIKDVLSGFEIRAKEKGIATGMYKDYEPIYVDCDEQKLREVLTNLMENAFKFTKDGGFIVGIDESEDAVKIWIKDSGLGIEPNDLQKLFHKFGRIDNSYTIATEVGGTGLGLYIVKLYVEGMGGKVGAISEGSGKGSTFWFTIAKNKITVSGYTSSK